MCVRIVMITRCGFNSQCTFVHSSLNHVTSPELRFETGVRAKMDNSPIPNGHRQREADLHGSEEVRSLVGGNKRQMKCLFCESYDAEYDPATPAGIAPTKLIPWADYVSEDPRVVKGRKCVYCIIVRNFTSYWMEWTERF